MIDFSNQTSENINARMLSNMRQDIDQGETSIANVSVAPTAIELSVVYEILNMIQNNSWILTAEGEYLDNKCLERGVVRKQPTKAIKMAYFNLRVAENTRFSTIGLEEALVYKTIEESYSETIYSFENILYNVGTLANKINYGYYYANDVDKFYYNGNEIQVNRVSTLPTPSSTTTNKYYFDTTSITLYRGVANVLFKAQVECETAGTIGNSYTGSILPIVNIQNLTYANINEIVLPGTDIETDLSLRARFLATLGSESFAGNITAYRSYTLSINGVGGVQVYPHYKGPGTVKLSIIDAQYNRATNALIELVQNTICPPQDGANAPSPLGYGMAPIGAKVDVGTATDFEIDLSFTAVITQGTDQEEIRTKVANVFEDYLLGVRQSWGDALITNIVRYPVNVYISRLTSALLTEIPDILNVSNMKLNNVASDIICVEEANYTTSPTIDLQQLPIVGSISITFQ